MRTVLDVMMAETLSRILESVHESWASDVFCPEVGLGFFERHNSLLDFCKRIMTKKVQHALLLCPPTPDIVPFTVVTFQNQMCTRMHELKNISRSLSVCWKCSFKSYFKWKRIHWSEKNTVIIQSSSTSYWRILESSNFYKSNYNSLK